MIHHVRKPDKTFIFLVHEGDDLALRRAPEFLLPGRLGEAICAAVVEAHWDGLDKGVAAGRKEAAQRVLGLFDDLRAVAANDGRWPNRD